MYQDLQKPTHNGKNNKPEVTELMYSIEEEGPLGCT
jgi:hypothetical protein